MRIVGRGCEGRLLGLEGKAIGKTRSVKGERSSQDRMKQTHNPSI